jgi:hypothetical protein
MSAPGGLGKGRLSQADRARSDAPDREKKWFITDLRGECDQVWLAFEG